jgi:hypothetical protein
MGIITVNFDYYERISNDELAASWQAEAKAHEKLMEKKAWAWGLQELLDKTTGCREKRFMRVVNAGSCACRSEELVAGSIAEGLRKDLSSLRAQRPFRRKIHYIVDSLVRVETGRVDLEDNTPDDVAEYQQRSAQASRTENIASQSQSHWHCLASIR